VRGRRKPPRLTYASLEEDPSYEHVADRTVRKRVGRRDLQRRASDASVAIVMALGRRKALWFAYETPADQLRALREAAYYDLGVEHGIAACAVHGFARPSKTVRALADKVVRDLLGADVSRPEALRAALAVAWAMASSARSRS
jgi:hypothetical protein